MLWRGRSVSHLLARLVGVLDGIGEVEVNDVVVVVGYVRLAALLAKLSVAALSCKRCCISIFRRRKERDL